MSSAKPRLLDLFCGAGGAAVGYARAGFEVVGVDLAAQPNYPYRFEQADALSVLRGFRPEARSRFAIYGGFDAIHASPPCQAYAGVTAWRGRREDHPALIAKTRTLLEQTGLPYVIENVPDARFDLRDPIRLCGSMFGLGVRRHRYFELGRWAWDGLLMPCHHQPDDLAFEHKYERSYADRMGCTWMSAVEARQAIPPAYTEFIGEQLLNHLEAHHAA